MRQEDHQGLWRLMKRTQLNQVAWIQDRMQKEDAEAEWNYRSNVRPEQQGDTYWIEPDVAVAGRFD